MNETDYDAFCAAARRGNLVPVCREVPADLETPVSVLARFTGERHAFLLESVTGGERWGRYSFIGIRPRALYTIRGQHGTLTTRDGAELETHTGPEALAALQRQVQDWQPVMPPGMPRFIGGLVGFLGYEMAGAFERLPEPKTETAWPDACFMLVDDLMIFDNVRHTLTVVACVATDQAAELRAAYEAGVERCNDLLARLRAPLPSAREPRGRQPIEVKLESETPRETFLESVRQARRHIIDGDIIQAVLSQRFSGEAPVDPFEAYRALRLINPSPYMFYLKFDDQVLVGSSPEVMVRRTGDRAELRPIAGTRPRGATEQEDRRLADELLGDEKERAEHVMLVDLGRNDLGRVAVPGSVQVKDFMTIERYSHVMHIVSQVEAQLTPEISALELIGATFPAGTLSGAPKIRAMEIIHALEPGARGPYGGAVGYIGYDGNLDLAIAIRTLQFEGRKVALQAGAGIVYDSDPEREFEETRNKARGMIKALELAAYGMDRPLQQALREKP